MHVRDEGVNTGGHRNRSVNRRTGEYSNVESVGRKKMCLIGRLKNIVDVIGDTIGDLYVHIKSNFHLFYFIVNKKS